MNSVIYGYVLQFLPVIGGIAFVAVARSVALTRDRITVIAAETREGVCLGNGASEGCDAACTTRDAMFESEAHDRLLVAGLLKRNEFGEVMRIDAFRKLGIAEVAWFSRHFETATARTEPRLTLFVRDEIELLAHLYFGRESGVLVQYLAGYALDVEAV
ncbi:MAG: hypothetical protein KGI04_01090 [Candidatus Micrarchaeota archaeon]|nr:hypothetical protein [Candidatus Micrarchaeota archaeon]